MYKKLCVFILLPLMLLLSASAYAETLPPEDEYLSIMLRAAVCGDIEAGHAAEKCRSVPPEDYIAFDELYLLAKIIYSEAGSDEIPAHWKQLVGEVVMNRVASPEFPDTLYEVIYQDGQYDCVTGEKFRWYTYPSEECVSIALRLLSGEHSIPSDVVFQSNYRLGGGVYASYSTDRFGCSYLCYSSRRELYGTR